MQSGSPEEALHYKGAIEPIEIMARTFTKPQFEGFLMGNIMKYSFRLGKKSGEPIEKDKEKIEAYSKWLKQTRELGYIILNGQRIETYLISGNFE